LVRAFENLNLN